MPEILDINELLGGGDNAEVETITFTFPDGEVVKLYYDDALHAYYTKGFDGTRFLVPGSTTVCGMIDKSGPLTQWAANETCNLIRAELAKKPLAAFTPEEIETLLNNARFNYRTISRQATDIGSMAHNWLEARIKAQIAGEHYYAAMPESPQACNCILAALDWMEKHKFRPVVSESKVYSRKWGFAGTTDWIAYITGCGDPECCPFVGEVLALGDFKSSKQLYDEYRAQLASYQEAWEELHPDQLIAVRVILRLGKEDGKFEPMVLMPEEFETDLDGFLGTLQAFNWMKQLTLNKKFNKSQAKKAKAKAKPKATPRKPRKTIRKLLIPQEAEGNSSYVPIAVEA